MTSEELLQIGFVDLGKWKANGEFIAYHLDGQNSGSNEAMLENPNALYAFVQGEAVCYIGKTARTIRRRFGGYCRPGISQRTNRRCHDKIKADLSKDIETRIFAFTPPPHLRYADFEINLAAGLEDSLIEAFDPPWNGRDKGQPISEEAEREEAEEIGQSSPSARGPDLVMPNLATFTITLGPSYYQRGLINPGVDASKHLGENGEPIRILLGDGDDSVVSSINRTANRTGAVRIVGKNQRIARWFQSHFHEGDRLLGRVLDRHTILLSSLKGTVEP